MAAGYALTVFDIDAAAVAAVVQLGAQAADTAAQAVGDITITLVPSSVEVRSAVFGANGAYQALQPGMVLVDLSGTDPDCARELQERLQEKRATFIGGTIHASGAPAVVIPKGQFAIVIGGPKSQIEATAGFLNHVPRPSFACRNRGCPRRSRSPSSCTRPPTT